MPRQIACGRGSCANRGGFEHLPSMRSRVVHHLVGLVVGCILSVWAAAQPTASGAGAQTNRPTPGQPRSARALDEETLDRIQRAIPAAPIVIPKRPRRLLIFDLNVGYGGHPSAAHASHAFKVMGERTGAFQTVISRDPSVFMPESLKQFDAVFFNNTVGNLFTDPALRESLVRFVYRGGGMLGVHGTSVAFTQWPGAIEDWPEFGLMIGARGANHRESNERVFVKLDDPDHPVTAPFSREGFEYRDEFFRVHDPYSRKRVRVLLSIDTQRTDLQQGRGFGDLERDDKDFALAWIRSYGRGRTFYCTIAHNPYVFWDPLMLKFYLGAIQFALGDLPAPTIPSAFATPAIRAQEKLGWRVACRCPDTMTVFEAADKAAELGLRNVAVSSAQQLSAAVPKRITNRLTPSELQQLRLKLDAVGVRLVSYEIVQAPAADKDWQRTFEFARDIGAEVVVAAPPASLPATLADLCREFDMRLALKPSGDLRANFLAGPGPASNMAHPHTSWIGLVFNPDASGGPNAGIGQVLRNQGATLTVVEFGGLTELASAGEAATAERFLEQMHEAKARPAMILLQLASGHIERTRQLVGTINQLSQRLTD